MPTHQERLLGRIALSSGMITQEQLDQCLALQEGGRTLKPLGDLLLERGYINRGQRDRLLAMQKKQLVEAADAAPRMEGKDEPVFGRMVLAKEMITAEQLNECLRYQERELARGRARNLGQVMVEKGYLTRDQVKAILADQQKIIVVCNGCGTRFNAASGSKLPKCPACGGVLAAPPWSVSLPVVDSIGSNGETTGLIGKVLGGFKLLEFAGRSAKGTLYKAQHPTLDRPMAAKIIPVSPESREMLSRYVQTAKALATLSHPNVLRVHAAGIHANYCYVVTDFIHGRPLNVFLDRGKGIPPNEALAYARSAARGLAAAHARKILHRDLTPDNILLSVGREVYVKDFCFARRFEVEEGGAKRVLAGSPAFLAPELWHGEAADARSDLYALGVTLYALLAGRKPFDSMKVPDLMRQHVSTPPAPLRVADPVTEALVAIVEKLLAKDRRARYASADELIHDLARAEKGEAPKAMTDPGAGGAPRAGGRTAAPKAGDFVCANCGSHQRIGNPRCTRCRVEICRGCQRQVSAVNGFCAECLSTGTSASLPAVRPPSSKKLPAPSSSKRLPSAGSSKRLPASSSRGAKRPASRASGNASRRLRQRRLRGS